MLTDPTNTATSTQIQRVRRGKRIALFCLGAALLLSVSALLFGQSSEQLDRQQAKQNVIKASGHTMRQALEAQGFVLLEAVDDNASLIFWAKGEIRDVTLKARIKFGACYSDIRATAPA